MPRNANTSKDEKCSAAHICWFSAPIKSCLEQKEGQKEAAGQLRVLCSCVSFVLAWELAPLREVPG